MVQQSSKLLSSLQRPEGSSFILSAISSHLRELGYPEKSINSMNRCGLDSGFKIIKSCGCGDEFKSVPMRCNLRTCSACSNVRKRRIYRKYLPFFRRYVKTKKDFLQFLTISPKNYSNNFKYYKWLKKPKFKNGKKYYVNDKKINIYGLEAGIHHLRDCFSKFLRRDYIKNRLKAGFYVLEVKQSKDGSWNIHIHLIIYGSWLDYAIRGKCNKCNQNLLKFDKFNKKYYCANRKCNSLDVIRYESTTLNREWKKSAKSNAHIYGERVHHIYGAVDYLTKYISIDKTQFNNSKDLAQYIYSTRKQKLISSFGSFSFHHKDYKLILTLKPIYICKKCGQLVQFSIDTEALRLINSSNPPPAQKSLRL